MTQELLHRTQKFMQLSGDYLGKDRHLFQAMATWPRHIDCFERKYDKAFVGDHLFSADIVNIIHKRVQVFLHLCNMTPLNNFETGELMEFKDLPCLGGASYIEKLWAEKSR